MGGGGAREGEEGEGEQERKKEREGRERERSKESNFSSFSVGYCIKGYLLPNLSSGKAVKVVFVQTSSRSSVRPDGNWSIQLKLQQFF